MMASNKTNYPFMVMVEFIIPSSFANITTDEGKPEHAKKFSARVKAKAYIAYIYFSSILRAIHSFYLIHRITQHPATPL